MEKDKIVFQGSHPDSLYRVASNGGAGGGKVARVLRLLRWPAALLLVCIALAVFVYFLMPENISDMDSANGTYWDPAGAQNYKVLDRPQSKYRNFTPTQGTKTPEIDFYGADTEKTYDIPPFVISATQTSATRKLPVQPVFPDHLTPEVQYGNEKADSNNPRNPKVIEESNDVSDESTSKPHITQQPEKPLQIFFKDRDGITTTTSTETIVKAETLNDLTNYGKKFIEKKTGSSVTKPQPSIYKDQYYNPSHTIKKTSAQQVYDLNPEIPVEIQEFYHPRQPEDVDVSFTSGHSKLFGISIEESEKMKSTTQTSTYNTRVSPTLPTWRDGDDSTTKKYPVNVNYDVPQCGSTRLAFCRGVLPYDLAGPAAVVNGVDLLQLLPQVEYLVATNCSDRVRQFMCALLEPECNPPPYPPKMPCYNLCKTITDNCEGLIPHDLAAAFNCNQYSSSNCIAAKGPCFMREFQCGDGSCVPRDWICDGAQDCSTGEDEQKCITCEPNEYRCQSGGCIQRRWMCDGYADCPNGEDELSSVCDAHGGPRTKPPHHPSAAAEPGEESAGSAPAPAVRKPAPLHGRNNRLRNQKIGDNENSKELLVTSDSNNALRRNYTRRPSLSRLSPYTRPSLQDRLRLQEASKQEANENSTVWQAEKSFTPTSKPESVEDVNVGDLGFFEDTDKDVPETKQADSPPQQTRTFGGVPTVPDPDLTHLDTSINKLEKVIDGAALLRKAAAAQQEPYDSPESNSTTTDKDELLPMPPAGAPVFSPGSVSAHASPCPSGELRCVDGRCITLAQLCDGTIDCSDHADEDNCYT